MGDVEGGYIPEVGDRINYRDYRRIWVDVPVTQVADMGGYTDIWVENQNHRMGALFNINHTTLLPNTQTSEAGSWSLVAKGSKTVHKFKVGDRVRVLKDNADCAIVNAGDLGTVKTVGSSGNWLTANMDIDRSREKTNPLWNFGRTSVELVTDPAPRKWVKSVPAEPAGVTRVRSVRNPESVYVRNDDGTWSAGTGGKMRWSWNRLLNGLSAGVEEFPESDYDAAVRWFRDNPEGQRVASVLGSLDAGKHLSAIVREVVKRDE